MSVRAKYCRQNIGCDKKKVVYVPTPHEPTEADFIKIPWGQPKKISICLLNLNCFIHRIFLLWFTIKFKLIT